MLLSLSNALQRPKSGCQVHCLLLWLQTHEILQNGSVLQGRSTLVQHDGVIVWHFKECSYLLFAHLRDLNEFWLSVRELHHTLEAAFVIDKAFRSFSQHSLRQYAWTCREVVSKFAVSERRLAFKINKLF